MASPDADVLDWASAVLGTAVTVLRGLRLGYDLAERTGHGLMLTTRMPGTSGIPA